MRNEVSAGGVVYNPTLKKILLIKDFADKWALPKGWIEKGETEEQAAVREVQEETGLKNLKILARLGETEYFYAATHNRDYGLKKGERVHKRVIFFLMETADEKLVPQWEIKGVEWFPVEDVLKTSGYANMEKILESAVILIRKIK
ncbi:MAG TPA: NUDIX domain-containing protein [archaeon]|nr:NUDIX domain-containing protein [archaeon]